MKYCHARASEHLWKVIHMDRSLSKTGEQDLPITLRVGSCDWGFETSTKHCYSLLLLRKDIGKNLHLSPENICEFFHFMELTSKLHFSGFEFVSHVKILQKERQNITGIFSNASVASIRSPN